jgi:hypothetical protein
VSHSVFEDEKAFAKADLPVWHDRNRKVFGAAAWDARFAASADEARLLPLVKHNSPASVPWPTIIQSV